MIASTIIISGVIYASSCRLADKVSEYGIKRGQNFAYRYLSIGLILEAVRIATL